MIILRCPRCGFKFAVRDTSRKVVNCPSCKRRMKVAKWIFLTPEMIAKMKSESSPQQ